MCYCSWEENRYVVILRGGETTKQKVNFSKEEPII